MADVEEKPTDELWREFAREFIGHRNECLAEGDVEGFVWAYGWLFDNILATSPKLKGMDIPKLREECIQTARDYAVQHAGEKQGK